MEENKNKIVRSDYVVKEKKYKNWFFRNWYKLLILLFLIFLDLVFVYGCKVREEYKSLTPNITVPIVKTPIKKLKPFDDNSSKTNVISGYDFASSDYNGGYGDFSFYFDSTDISSHVNYNIYNVKNEYYCSFSLKDDEYVNVTFSLRSLEMGWADSDLSFNSSYLIVMSYFNDIYNETTFNYMNSNLDTGLMISYDSSIYTEDYRVNSIFSSLYYLDSDVSFDVSSVLNFSLYSNFGDDVFTFNFNNVNDVITYHLFDLKVIEIYNNTDGDYSNTDSIQANYNYGYNDGLRDGQEQGYRNGLDTVKNDLYDGKTYNQIIDIGKSQQADDDNTIIAQLQEQLSQYDGKTYTQIFNEGKNEGIASVQEGDLNNLFKTAAVIVFNSPYNILHNVFNFEFLGVNLFNLFSFLITCSIIIFIIKMVW